MPLFNRAFFPIKERYETAERLVCEARLESVEQRVLKSHRTYSSTNLIYFFLSSADLLLDIPPNPCYF